MLSLTESAGNRATTLATLEPLARSFAAEHHRLADLMQDFDSQVEQLKRRYAPHLRARVAAAAQARQLLHTAIAGSPGLFVKPRTLVLHGVKLGFQKGRGGIEFDDADKVLALLRKKFGAGAPAYIRTTETPDKKMLAELTVTELKQIGCTVTDTSDTVVIKPADSEIERTVATLLQAPEPTR